MSESGASANTAISHVSVFNMSNASSDGTGIAIPNTTADEVLDELIRQEAAKCMPPPLRPISLSATAAQGSSTQDDESMTIEQHQGRLPPVAPHGVKRLAMKAEGKSSISRGRDPTSSTPRVKSRQGSRSDSDASARLKKLEKSAMQKDKTVARLEKLPEDAKNEAKQNELAWEHLNEQKSHEVGRLQSLVSHASKQNEQLRWDKAQHEVKVQEWATQAMAFKQQAEKAAEHERVTAAARDEWRRHAGGVTVEAQKARMKSSQ